MQGQIEGIDQSQFIHPEIELKPAPKIFKDTCEIQLDWNIEKAYDFVRGLSPYPAAWMDIQFPGQPGKVTLKVFETEKEPEEHSLPIGTVVTDGKKFAKVALSDGFIQLKAVQVSGKKRMDIGELLRGMR